MIETSLKIAQKYLTTFGNLQTSSAWWGGGGKKQGLGLRNNVLTNICFFLSKRRGRLMGVPAFI